MWKVAVVAQFEFGLVDIEQTTKTPSKTSKEMSNVIASGNKFGTAGFYSIYR
jgi:hypothetical protein